MKSPTPELLALIAGRGSYPLQLAESARRQGVKKLFAVAFSGETERRIAGLVDSVVWVRVGQLDRLLAALTASGARHAVMAGQLTPTHLFRVRMDGAMLALLRSLKERNAETIFGAVGDLLRQRGIELLPASCFMESAMPAEGCLTALAPDEPVWEDIRLGMRVARATSGLDIGQTVVIKQGTILAIEAFEGTDAAIRRAGKLGGPGAVIVKLAKENHDMRFDIPVVGRRTLQLLAKIRARALALEAGRAIVLDREDVLAMAARRGISIVAVRCERPSAPGGVQA